ncbi:MAG TPA: flavin reductase family protein, partial [Flavobacteriales bacterium]|nr:flavin reductase family protein [Flavobacteriales bacterium]
VLALPDETRVNEHKLTELADLFIQHQGRSDELRTALHHRAHQLLLAGQVEEALLTVLAFNDR